MAFIPGAIALASAAGTTATAAGITIASTAATVIGTGVSAYGMMRQGQAAKKEADYNAAVQENNAVTAGYAAIQEQQAAARDADTARDRQIRLSASQRVAAAGSGLTISGSVNDTIRDSAIASETDIQMMLYGGRVAAYNASQQQQNLRSQASMTRYAGRSARRSAYAQAGGTILSGLTQAGLGYAKFKG